MRRLEKSLKWLYIYNSLNGLTENSISPYIIDEVEKDLKLVHF